jgi:hypothetical protein
MKASVSNIAEQAQTLNRNTKKKITVDPVVMLWDKMQKLDSESTLAYAAADAAYELIPEEVQEMIVKVQYGVCGGEPVYAYSEKDLTKKMGEWIEAYSEFWGEEKAKIYRDRMQVLIGELREKEAKIREFEDSVGYRDLQDKAEYISEQQTSCEAEFLNSKASTAAGILLQATHILECCNDMVFDKEDEDKYIASYMDNAIQLSGYTTYGSLEWADIEKARELLREAKVTQKITKVRAESDGRGLSPAGVTISTYKPIEEHNGNSITYLGEYNITRGQGIMSIGRRWRVQTVKYGSFPLEVSEVWDGYKRWFAFDDIAVREFYNSTNTKPDCNYVYLLDYPPHPGEEEFRYSERMSIYADTFDRYLELKAKGREKKAA